MPKISPVLIDGIRAHRQKTAEGLLDVFERWQTEKRTFDEWYALEIGAYGSGLIERYISDQKQRAANLAAMATDKVPFDPEGMFPSFAAICMIVLVEAMKKGGIPDEKAFDTMLEFLRSDSMSSVPFNRISASYWASFAVKVGGGQKTPPNGGAANDAEIVSTQHVQAGLGRIVQHPAFLS